VIVACLEEIEVGLSIVLSFSGSLDDLMDE